MLILTAAALAGCVGGETQDIASPPTSAQATDDSGAISGTVVDEESLPVAGATVAVIDEELETTTDEAGAFAFNNLTAGTFKLVVQKLGYESAARSVDVRLGEVASIDIQLRTLEVSVDPFIVILPFDGYIHCGVNPYWPTNVCGDSLGEDKARFPFDVDANWSLEELVVELTWTPATAATAQHLEMDLCNEVPAEEDTLLCFEGNYWDYESGKSPVVMRKDDVPVEDYTRYMVAVGAGFINTTDPTSLLPAIQQQFTLYVSQCYVEECSEAFTARPPE